MTERQYMVERAKLDAQKAEIALREAHLMLQHGAAAAKAAHDREYDKLKIEVDKAANALEVERLWLKRKEAEATEEPWKKED